jgi:hypothetical protein
MEGTAGRVEIRRKSEGSSESRQGVKIPAQAGIEVPGQPQEIANRQGWKEIDGSQRSRRPVKAGERFPRHRLKIETHGSRQEN